MFCENCGSKALDDAVFCQKCGAKINYDTVEQGQKESLVEVSDGFTTYVVDFISEAKNDQQYDKIFNSVAEAVMDSYHLIY